MIEVKKQNLELIVISLEGSLNFSNQAKIKEELARLIPPRIKRVVLDFSRVEFIDSSCLGALISVMRQLKERGGELQILAPQAEVRSILQITRLDKVFTLIEKIES